ncbi:MAG: DUF3794 domain-containing protein, partial [Clostridiales bacterium]|nr:DUF3794 domain-containing protein [Clostridiales bacterium]
EAPFTEIFDVAGADENMTADLRFAVKSVAYDAEEDSDGDCRILAADVRVGFTGRVTRQFEVEVVEDIYSTETELHVTRSTALLDKMVADTQTQITLSDAAALPAESPDIARVYNVIAKPYLASARVEHGKAVVEGVIDTYILYLSDSPENPLSAYKHETKFNRSLDAEHARDDMLCDVHLDVSGISYTIGGAREVQLRCVLGIGVRVISSDKIEYVSDITADAEAVAVPKTKCAIKIYFVQKGDKLWDVAKKYRTTAERILQANEIAEEAELAVGKQLIIP